MTTRHKSRSGAHNVDTAQGVLTILQAYDRGEPLNLTPEQHRRLLLLLSGTSLLDPDAAAESVNDGMRIE